jgi:hypothetical protein
MPKLHRVRAACALCKEKEAVVYCCSHGCALCLTCDRKEHKSAVDFGTRQFNTRRNVSAMEAVDSNKEGSRGKITEKLLREGPPSASQLEQASRRAERRAGACAQKQLQSDVEVAAQVGATAENNSGLPGVTRDCVDAASVAKRYLTDGPQVHSALENSGLDTCRADARPVFPVIVPAIGVSALTQRPSESVPEPQATETKDCALAENPLFFKPDSELPSGDSHWANQIYISSSGSSSVSGSGETAEKISDFREGAPSLETPPNEGQSSSQSSTFRDGPGRTTSSSDLQTAGVLPCATTDVQAHVRHPIVAPAVLILCDSCGAMPAVAYCTERARFHCELCMKYAHASGSAPDAPQELPMAWQVQCMKSGKAADADMKGAHRHEQDPYASSRSRCGDSGDSGSAEREPTSESPSGGDQGTSHSGNGGSREPTSSSPAETAATTKPQNLEGPSTTAKSAHSQRKTYSDRGLSRSVAMMMLLDCSVELPSRGSEELSAEGGDDASAESISEQTDAESMSLGHESARSGEFRADPCTEPTLTSTGLPIKWATAISEEDLAAAAERAVRVFAASSNSNGTRSTSSRHASSNDLSSAIVPGTGTHDVATAAPAVQSEAAAEAAPAQVTGFEQPPLPACCIDITTTDARRAISIAKNEPFIIGQRSRPAYAPSSPLGQQPTSQSTGRRGGTHQRRLADASEGAKRALPFKHQANTTASRWRKGRATGKNVDMRPDANHPEEEPLAPHLTGLDVWGPHPETMAIIDSSTLAQAETARGLRSKTGAPRSAEQMRGTALKVEGAAICASSARAACSAGGQAVSAPRMRTSARALESSTRVDSTPLVPWRDLEVQQAPSLSKPQVPAYVAAWSASPSQPSLADFVEAPLECRRSISKAASAQELRTASGRVPDSRHRSSRETAPGLATRTSRESASHPASAQTAHLVEEGATSRGCPAGLVHLDAGPRGGHGVASIAVGTIDGNPAKLRGFDDGSPAARLSPRSGTPVEGSFKMASGAGIPGSGSSQQARYPTVSGLSRRRAESARAKVDRWLLGATQPAGVRRCESPFGQPQASYREVDVLDRAAAGPGVIAQPQADQGNEDTLMDDSDPALETGQLRNRTRELDKSAAAEPGQGSELDSKAEADLAMMDMLVPDFSKYATPLPHGLMSRSTPSSSSGNGETSSTGGGDLEPSPLAAKRTLRVEVASEEARRMHSRLQQHKSSGMLVPRMTASWSAEVKSAAHRRHSHAHLSSKDAEQKHPDETSA